jgi:hypothetical protein
MENYFKPATVQYELTFNVTNPFPISDIKHPQKPWWR